MSVVCSLTLARMGVPAATRSAAIPAYALMAGVARTALKTLMTVLQLHAPQAPRASTVLHRSFVSALTERQVGQE